MERQRKCKLDSEMEKAFQFKWIIFPDGYTNRLLLHFPQFLLI